MWWMLLLVACSPTDNDVDEGVPLRAAGALAHDPPEPSTLLVPISLPLVDLERILDHELPSVLVTKQGLPLKRRGVVKGSLDVTVFRTGDPKLQGRDDGRVRLTMPLRAEVTLHKPRRPPIEVEGAMRATADIDLGLTEDWRLDPQIDLTYTWLGKPKARVLGLRLEVQRIVDKRLSPKLPDLARIVERALRKLDVIRTPVANAWAQLREPQPTKGEPPGWFAVRPETVYAGRLTSDRTHLHLVAGIRGIAAMGLGEPPALPAVELPPVAPPPPDPELCLPVSIALSWDELSVLANERLANNVDQPLVVEGVELALALAGIEIYPSGDKLAVGLGYRSDGRLWSSNGTAWLLAEPRVDPETRKLQMSDFDYTVETMDFALGLANRDLVRDNVRQAVAGYLEFDYGERIDGALSEINARIADIELPKGAGLVHARLTDVDVRGVSLLEEALVIRTHVSGSAEVALMAPNQTP